MSWRASVTSNADHTDPLSRFARLLIWEAHGDWPGIPPRYISVGGGALIEKTYEEGTSLRDEGLILPVICLPAIRDAIDKHLGVIVGNHEAENKVLREWLAVEQRRVDEDRSRI